MIERERIVKFLEELATHIAGIDSHCDHCIEQFLELGEWDDEAEEHAGGVNALLAKHYPQFQFKHTRSKTKQSTVELIVDETKKGAS